MAAVFCAILIKILPRSGVHKELIDGTDLSAWENASAEPTKLVFLEVPSTLVLGLVDIR